VRATLAAWLGGQDLKAVLSRATLFRHAKVLREYGVDILETRNVVLAKTKVRVVELEPLAVPDWHWARAA
jgi:II/X family phage/plasmid replication protein